MKTWPSQAGTSCMQHIDARVHRAEANAALLPLLLMGPKVTNRHIMAINTAPTGRAAGFGKPLLGGAFYTYVRNRTNLHKKSVLLTQHCHRHPRFLPRSLHSGGRRAEAEWGPGDLGGMPSLRLPSPFLHSPPWLCFRCTFTQGF